MKVFIDTNVILDVLCGRKEFLADALKIFRLCETQQLTGYISALSVTNLIYIMRKELSPAKIREVLEKLAMLFHVTDLQANDLKKAADLMFKDYEDALQSISASRVRADVIITRNVRDYEGSKIKAVHPSDFLLKF